MLSAVIFLIEKHLEEKTWERGHDRSGPQSPLKFKSVGDSIVTARRSVIFVKFERLNDNRVVVLISGGDERQYAA